MKRALGILMVAAFMAAVMWAGAASAATGDELWASKQCKNCHNMTEKKKVGPGLAGVTKKRSDEWLAKWLQSPQAVWEENGPEVKDLRAMMKKESAPKTAMKTPAISADEAKTIIEYLKANGG